MNEQEMIDYLKGNKEHCVIYMKMPKPVQEYVEKKIDIIHLQALTASGDWTPQTNMLRLYKDMVYALPDDYEEPKVEQEILEFDVTDDLSYSIDAKFKDIEYPIYYNIASPKAKVITDDATYLFIGYKFEGSDKKWNDYLLYRARDLKLFKNSASDRKPVYASKVVYKKVG